MTLKSNVWKWKENETNSPYSYLFNYSLIHLFWYNEFTEVRQDLLMNQTHYDPISATWAIDQKFWNIFKDAWG